MKQQALVDDKYCSLLRNDFFSFCSFPTKSKFIVRCAPTPKKAEETDANIGNKRKKMGPFYPAATCPLLNKLE